MREKDEEIQEIDRRREEVKVDLGRKIACLDKKSKEKEESQRPISYGILERQLLDDLQSDFKQTKEKNVGSEKVLRDKKERMDAYLRETVEEYDDIKEKKSQQIGGLETELNDIEREIKAYEEEVAILRRQQEKEEAIERKIGKKREVYELDKARIDSIVHAIQNSWKSYQYKLKAIKKKSRKQVGTTNNRNIGNTRSGNTNAIVLNNRTTNNRPDNR